jgi:Rho-binding antiterminator
VTPAPPPEPDYRPIACGLHDELQLRALQRRPVLLRWCEPDGTPRVVTEAIVDVFTRGGAEYLRTAPGTEIRLDRLSEVDGIAFAGDC